MSQSVERAAQLLLWLADRAIEDGHLDHGLKEMAEGAGLDKATAHRLARSLAKYGLVRHDDVSRRYQLGAAAIRLGRAGMNGHVTLERCLPLLKTLASETGETISLSERQDLRSVTIYEIESRQVVRYANRIGRSVPLHVAAGARAILAFSDEQIVAAVLDGALDASTTDTIIDPVVLEQVLLEVKSRGYATSFGERTAGVHSLSAPIRLADGNAAGSVSILWPSRGEEIDTQRLQEWPEMLLRATKQLNDQYGTEVA